MNQGLYYWVVLAICLAILSCGRDEVRNRNEGTAPQYSGSATLAIFAGYTCESCIEELPALQKHLNDTLGDHRNLVKVDTYVTNGPNGGSVNEETADQYGKQLGVDFNMIPDWRCKKYYAQYYEDWKRCLVPAAVLLDQDGKVVKNFGRGKVDLNELSKLIDGILNG